MSPTEWADGAVEEAEPVARPVDFARRLSLEPSWAEAGGMTLGAGLSG